MSHRKVLLLIVSCCILAFAGYSVFAQQASAPSAAPANRPPAPIPLEDKRPPLFLRESFKMDAMAETYLSQANISAPNVDLKIYGQTQTKWIGKKHEDILNTPLHGGIEIVWRPSPKDDPTFVYWGPCFTPCAIAFRDRNNMVDLTDLAKIKWRTKQSGFHQLQPIVKLADGRWFIGDYAEGPASDWLEKEFSLLDIRWKEFDADKVVTKGTGNFVPSIDLSKVDEVGVTSLATGNAANNGHGAASTARLDWIEIYGRPVKR